MNTSDWYAKVVLCLGGMVAIGGVLAVDVHANEKFRVEGEILHYNTDMAVLESQQEINSDDVEYFKKILKGYPDIETVYLTSWGGYISDSTEIADLIIDYELNTHAEEICFSSCVTIFLGGEKRTLTKGARIGFHQGWWDKEDIKEFYEDQDNKAYYEWDDIYDFVAWMYEDTQTEMYNEFKYMLERGVDPAFAIETLKVKSDEDWYPRRKELLEASVLTE